MNLFDLRNPSRGESPSPWGIVLLAVNAICLGGSLVLLALGIVTGPLVLLAIGTGLSVLAALAAGRRHRPLAAQPQSLNRHP